MKKNYPLFLLSTFLLTITPLFATAPLIIDYENYSNNSVVTGTKTGRTKAYKNPDGSTYAVISAGYDGVNYPSPYYSTDNVCIEMMVQTLPSTDGGTANIQLNSQKVDIATGTKTATEREFGRIMVGKSFFRSQKPDPTTQSTNINDVDFATGLTPLTWYKLKVSVDIKNQKYQAF